MLKRVVKNGSQNAGNATSDIVCVPDQNYFESRAQTTSDTQKLNNFQGHARAP